MADARFWQVTYNRDKSEIHLAGGRGSTLRAALCYEVVVRDPYGSTGRGRTRSSN